MGAARVEIFVQARMASTRLPGKVLKQVLGKPLLGFLLERLARVKGADACVVVTSINPKDDAIVGYCKENGIPCYRGPEEDVLTRFYQVAKERAPDAIVRICADCPLIDPEVVDLAISNYKSLAPSIDYLSNCLKRSYPRGMDTEVFSLQALEQAYTQAQTAAEREHVTPFIYQHPEFFQLQNLEYTRDFSHLRLTVDTIEDFSLIAKILEGLYPQNKNFSLADVLKLLELHPELTQINAHVQQKNYST